jgi:hypothetical protein
MREILFRLFREEYISSPTNRMRVRGGYTLFGLVVVLLLAVSVLPWVRRTFSRSFPEGFQSMVGVDTRRGDCKGVNCQEGEFCQENVCRPVAAPITNDYFPDK